MSHDTTPAGAAARTSTVARRTTLIVLTLIATVQFFDRALMVVVMEPIKSEFALSDSQLGLLAGFSYAAAFALAGIPLGWVADRTNRRNLLALLLAVWSALVALAGSAGSFAALVATRVGIGAADAGGQPCSVSTIADLYPRDKRAGAVAVFYVGVPLGMLLGFMAGGFIAAQYGWRTGFYVAAVPGVVLTLALLLFTREPRRGAADVGAHDALPPSLGATLRFMRGQSSLMLIMAASVLVTASSSAMMSWIGSLLVRSHGLTLQQVGLVTALCMGGVGALGNLASGALADRLTRRDARWQLGVPLVGIGAALPLGLAYLALGPRDTALAVALVIAFGFFIAWWVAPSYAALSLVVAPARRGTANAMLMLAGAVGGGGIGPVLTGAVSDLLAGHVSGDPLRWALALMVALLAPSWLAFSSAMRAYPAARRAALGEAA